MVNGINLWVFFPSQVEAGEVTRLRGQGNCASDKVNVSSVNEGGERKNRCIVGRGGGGLSKLTRIDRSRGVIQFYDNHLPGSCMLVMSREKKGKEEEAKME